MFKAIWAVLLGISKHVLAWALPLLKGAAMQFAADPDVQAAARTAVMGAAMKYLGSDNAAAANDAKFRAAVAELNTVMLDKGKQVAAGWLATAVQTAFENLKAEGVVQ